MYIHDIHIFAMHHHLLLLFSCCRVLLSQQDWNYRTDPVMLCVFFHYDYYCYFIINSCFISTFGYTIMGMRIPYKSINQTLLWSVGWVQRKDDEIWLLPFLRSMFNRVYRLYKTSEWNNEDINAIVVTLYTDNNDVWLHCYFQFQFQFYQYIVKDIMFTSIYLIDLAMLIVNM